MKILQQFIYFLLICLIYSPTTSTQLIPYDHCDAADIEALAKWYSQLYKCVSTNDNISQQLTLLHDKFHDLQTEIKTQTLEESSQIISLKHDLQALKSQLQELKLQQLDNHKEIVIQRRQDGSEDFFRTWDEYKRGFGNATGEFFIGLEKLHKLTNSRPYELLVIMEDFENDRRFAKYDQFVVGSEKEKYALKTLGTYQGTAGESLAFHVGHKFSTKDQDNDATDKEFCAMKYTGAWWYNNCHQSNLNGRYLKGQHVDHAQGVNWLHFRGHYYSLKFVEMILRPK